MNWDVDKTKYLLLSNLLSFFTNSSASYSACSDFLKPYLTIKSILSSGIYSFIKPS